MQSGLRKHFFTYIFMWNPLSLRYLYSLLFSFFQIKFWRKKAGRLRRQKSAAELVAVKRLRKTKVDPAVVERKKEGAEKGAVAIVAKKIKIKKKRKNAKEAIPVPKAAIGLSLSASNYLYSCLI